MPRIELDRDRCEGHGQCVSAAPGIFELDDDGELKVLEPEVSPKLAAEAHAGADVCPVRALQILG
ncbi:MAG: ferredoxin [Mycobacterium sp.]